MTFTPNDHQEIFREIVLRNQDMGLYRLHAATTEAAVDDETFQAWSAQDGFMDWLLAPLKVTMFEYRLADRSSCTNSLRTETSQATLGFVFLIQDVQR